MTIFVVENLTQRVKNVSYSRTVVLSEIQWFIVVTFKYYISKEVLYELGDCRQTLDL